MNADQISAKGNNEIENYLVTEEPVSSSQRSRRSDPALSLNQGLSPLQNDEDEDVFDGSENEDFPRQTPTDSKNRKCLFRAAIFALTLALVV